MARIEVSSETDHKERNWRDEYKHTIFLFDDETKRVIRRVEIESKSTYPNQSPSFSVKEEIIPFEAVPEAVTAKLKAMGCN
jgi:hypothetical protein